MAWAQQKHRRWYSHWALWTILILGAGVFLAWPRLKGCYQSWNAGNQVRQAEESLAGRDYKRAVMTARIVLSVDPSNVGATRIVAEALEAIGSPEAVQWRNRLDSLMPGNVENLLAWAADTMKAGDLEATERVLGMIAPDARETAPWHEINAQLSMAKRDAGTAEKHWAEAVQLDPKQDRYRLLLATLRMRSPDAGLRIDAMAVLTELSEKSPRNVGALRILLDEALRTEDWKKAESLSKSLTEEATVTFGDKLTRLATLRRMNTQDAPGYLVELRNGALSKPEEFYTLLMWMNENQLSMLVSEWVRTLPQDVIGAPPVCVAVADAYVRAGEWKKLRFFLEDHAWGDLDYFRRAFLARALDRLDEPEQSAQEWKDGLAAARSRQDSTMRIERLARVALTWKWEQRAEEVLWLLAGTPGCSRWVLDHLWALSWSRSDTAQLHKLAGALVQADSKSAVLRNHYAFFSLLVRSEQGSPHREAERLFNENPGNAAIAVTRGLSLHLQGNFVGAAAITGSLPPAELAKPQIALYHAIFLTAAGESAKAGEFLTAAQDWKMFPEEKTLLERANQSRANDAGEMEIAEAAKVARAQRAAREAEGDKAVGIARAARAARAAQAAADAAQPPSAAK